MKGENPLFGYLASGLLPQFKVAYRYTKPSSCSMLDLILEGELPFDCLV